METIDCAVQRVIGERKTTKQQQQNSSVKSVTRLQQWNSTTVTPPQHFAVFSKLWVKYRNILSNLSINYRDS